MADDVVPGDKPNAAPAGQTPSDPPAKGFDPRSYLETLPEDERAAKAALPVHILEREHQRQMLRSDYDRKRGQESQELRELVAQNQRLQGRLEAAMALQSQPPAEPEATVEELAAKLYEAQTPEEYAKLQSALVQRGVGTAVQQALETNPLIRQVASGLALREMRSSAGDDFAETDYDSAMQTAQADLQADGADISMLEPAALKAYLKPHLRAAKAERMLQARGPADTPPPTPAAPSGGPTLPVRGSGVGGTPPPSPARPVDGDTLSTDDKIARALGRAGLTREQAADARRRR